MIIKPKVRGFVCITAHPDGCDAHIKEQIDYVKNNKPLNNTPKRVLVLGASTGYGLSSRIVAAFAGNADTFGVFYERPGEENKPASAGWYNNIAFEKYAKANGRKAISMNGDAFSKKFKNEVVEAIKENFGKIDCIIYSLAAPRRTDEASGETYKSALKPIGQNFSGKTLNTDKGEVFDVQIDAANDEEIFQTVKVMGGEDWQEWISILSENDLLEKGITTIAYSYLGPKITWPIYKDGTIGKAKEHLAKTAVEINSFLSDKYNGSAIVSVNKAVVTQASSAIPVVPLYISILFKIMKAKNIHEDCIHQIYRLFNGLFAKNCKLQIDSPTCVRLDDLELNDEIQSEVAKVWQKISSENLNELSDFTGYQQNFLKLFGFGIDSINYDIDVNP